MILACSAARGQVSAREETITMPTWEIGPAEVHSNYWDAAGRAGEKNVYPYTLKDILTNRKADKAYRGVVLENEYIKVLVLPEIGGRLHGALDKTNGYVWLYWQRTIKPGLISMTGAWISGGIEWNFPHGHRPSGFSPVDHRIVRHADGSATVWVGETEPIYRMRWLVGMTIFPGRSYVRCEYILINPTDHTHPFQMWATAATHANEYAQAQYPGDVVTGHGKHEFWNWPVHNGVDLTWWKNSPNASSYFAFNNPADWFGAYDHRAQGGLVHVADHRVMPGKKLWTWGSGPSGRIWEDILTEGGGAYFEPQAGAWSDNQPDYHWIRPHEVKIAHDYWYPVRDTRGYHNATPDFAVNTEVRDGKAFGAVYATGVSKGCRVVLKDTRTGTALAEATLTISPDKPWTFEKPVPGITVHDLHLAVNDARGKLAVELQQQPPRKIDLPPGQKDPAGPEGLNQDERYHAGEWLDKFVRTREAVPHYRAALQQDPKDSRANAEMGFLALKQGSWEEALRYLSTALERDSDNGRLYFGRALAYQGLGRRNQAYDEFFRAANGGEYYAPAYLNLARLDLARGDWRAALEKTSEAASRNGKFADIPGLAAAAHRTGGQYRKALTAADHALELDAMHFMGGRERMLALQALKDPAAGAWATAWHATMRDDPQNWLELASAYAGAGLYRDAGAVLADSSRGRQDAALNPMVNYMRGWLQQLAGNPAAAPEFFARARKGAVDYTNPHRLEEAAALEAALAANPADDRAHLFLGNLLYSKERREEAFAHWQRAAELNPQSVHALRNVAYAQRYLKKDAEASYAAYRRAAALAPADARVLLELEQVAQWKGVDATGRLALLEQNRAAVEANDELSLRLIDLQIQAGDPARLTQALARLREHHFHVWEGRYEIHDAWVDANQRLGDLAFEARRYPEALAYYKAAGDYPKNLEVAPRTPDFQAHVNWNVARTALAAGDRGEGAARLKQVLAERYVRPHLGFYYQALAHRALGDTAQSAAALAALEKHARALAAGPREAVGRWLLALVLAERGDSAGAASERAAALQREPKAARMALLEAQLEYASAHQ